MSGSSKRQDRELDDSGGVTSGGAPSESNSFAIDVNWGYPFQVGGASFSIEGHVESVGGRTNQFGDPVSAWIYGQPQFRFDLGRALFHSPDRLFVGVEYQFWINKLGDPATDENAVQALAVWRF